MYHFPKRDLEFRLVRRRGARHCRGAHVKGWSFALGPTSHPSPARTVQIEVEPRQGALVVQDHAGEGPAVRGFHWSDSRQVPVGPRHITEVGHVLSPDLRNGGAKAEELTQYQDSASTAGLLPKP